MNHTVTKVIIQLFRQYGHIEYGERCTQLSHSVQAGLIAKEKGYDNELILAAFLHDIGHLCPLDNSEENYQTMGKFGIEAHDLWGEHFLQNKGFSKRIVATVKNHVAAKRYLCFVEPNYYDALSDASKATLHYQCGPMDSVEVKQFEQDTYFSDSLLIRRIDEEAKVEDFEILPAHWRYFESLLDHYLSNKSIISDKLSSM